MVKRVTVTRQPLWVCVDTDELDLGLFNVILNAKEVIGDGGRIAMTAGMLSEPEPRLLLPPGQYVEIRTEESLAGAAADPDEIFASAAPEDGRFGGFGLSQLRELCVRAGGTASVAAQPGQPLMVSLLLKWQGRER